MWKNVAADSDWILMSALIQWHNLIIEFNYISATCSINFKSVQFIKWLLIML